MAAASLVALGVALNLERLRPTEEASATDEIFAAVAAVEPAGPIEHEAQTRHRGEEGKMGRSVLDQPGLTASSGSSFPGTEGEDVWGGLQGTEIGQAFGVGGLGLTGTGRGGGGTGSAVGTLGIIGGGSAYGFEEFSSGTHRLPPSSVAELGFTDVDEDRRSTFSIDVDTASYSAMRAGLEVGSLPHPDTVRIEEWINYFDYDYVPPAGDAPFSIVSEVGECPWNPDHQLVHVGLQGKVIADEDLPPRNLVFLIDVSGSMNDPDKLPLVKRSLMQLTRTLRAEDRISLVVYAGAAGVVLPPTSGADKPAIFAALGRLRAGGGTNGGAGIELAYAQARAATMDGGVNRVILATDGDFNVGVSSHKELVRLIERERRSGVELSVLGYGMGHRDHTMEQLADKGNGNYAYIDGPEEAHKVLVEQAGGTLVTIAKDVKIQVELDPARVQSYRLVGYDNRRLAHRDFADDTKDAGEIGAGHSVTALYEVVPKEGAQTDAPWMTLSVRYKAPKGRKSSLLQVPVVGPARDLNDTSDDFRFSAAVAAFGMILSHSALVGTTTLGDAQRLALDATGDDPSCRRHRLAELMNLAARLGGGDDVTTREVPACEPGRGRVQDEPEPVDAPVVADDPPPVTAVASEPANAGDDDRLAWVLEVLRLLPPLLALPLFVMALRRPRRRR